MAIKRTNLGGSVTGQQLGYTLRPGMYYSPVGRDSTTVATADALLATPFFVGRTVTLSHIAVNVTVAAAASSIRLGIYADVADAYGGYPGSLVGEAATTADSTTIGFKAIAFTPTLSPGLYWFAGVAQGGTPTVSTLNGPNQFVGISSVTFLSTRGAYRHGGVTGALPATFTATPDAQGGAMQITVRIAS